MELLILLGFVLLGALLIGLGLGHRFWQVHRSWRRIPSPPLARQSDRSHAAKGQMPARHFPETYSPYQQTQLDHARRPIAADGLGSVNRLQPHRLAARQMASNRSQQVNPAVSQEPINRPQQINPGFQQPQKKPAQPAQLASEPPELILTRSRYLSFNHTPIRQTQIRSPRRGQPIAGQPELISPQPRYSDFKQTQTRPSQRLKPVNQPTKPIPPLQIDSVDEQSKLQYLKAARIAKTVQRSRDRLDRRR